MAEDINLTTILAPLSGAAQIKRVKSIDPENERRPPEEHRRQRRNRKDRRKLKKRAKDAVDVKLNKQPQARDDQRSARTNKNQKKTDRTADENEKSINIRV